MKVSLRKRHLSRNLVDGIGVNQVEGRKARVFQTEQACLKPGLGREAHLRNYESRRQLTERVRWETQQGPVGEGSVSHVNNSQGLF